MQAERSSILKQKWFRFLWPLLTLIALLPFLYWLGPHEQYTEFNTATWQLRSRESVWGCVIEDAPYAGTIVMWGVGFEDHQPWHVGPQAYYATEALPDNKWQVVERSNLGIIMLKPDIGSREPEERPAYLYRTMLDCLVEMCAIGSYGPDNPSIGKFTQEAQSSLVDNCRVIFERAQDPAEVCRYLIYVYQRRLWVDPVSKRWRKELGGIVDLRDLPSVSEFDARDLKQYAPEDFRLWMQEG